MQALMIAATANVYGLMDDSQVERFCLESLKKLGRIVGGMVVRDQYLQSRKAGQFFSLFRNLFQQALEFRPAIVGGNRQREGGKTHEQLA